MKIEGEARGMTLKDDATYIINKKGKEGLKKVEEALEGVGQPIKYGKIQTLAFYPAGWRALSLLAMKKVFGWGDEEFRELGGFAPSDSLIVRVYSRFFHSVDKMVEMAPRVYKEYLTKGELTIPDYNVEKKYAIMEIRGCDLHPLFCRILEGYFGTFVKMVVEAKEMECRETMCTFEGQDRHQFKATWK